MEFGTKPESDRPESAKKERSEDEQSQRRVKAAKGSDAMLLSSPAGLVDAQLRSGSLVFEDERNMLSFSSAGGVGDEKTPQNAAFQLSYPQSVYSRSLGDCGIAGTLNSSNMHVPFAGAKQLFTQTQWFELEQQALIYKYIAANVSVPSNLIIPIKKSFNPWGLSAPISVNGSLSSSSFGWGPFHLGFPSSADPEPGRCRRTDGKKWRCAKDAVHGHKYCDKHLNRGRHRSRKPVEGQNADQSVTGATNFAKVVPKASVIPSGSCANALAVPLHHSKGTHPAGNLSTYPLAATRTPDLQGISKDASFAIPKPKDPFEESYQSEFGFVSSDYLQNPYHKISSSLSCKNYNGSFMDFSDQESQDQHPLRQFMEDWPKERSEHSSISWQEETKPDWTKLSMSIPMVSSGFSSSASSPTHERLALSPLRLGREFHQNEMGLGSNNEFSESFHKEPIYMPNSPWGNSAGGPLGEVLKTSSSKRPLSENPSALNLMTKEWDSAKAQFEPSPTGVLLKSAFGSVSNSSSGSSPRAESRMTSEVGSLRDDPRVLL